MIRKTYTVALIAIAAIGAPLHSAWPQDQDPRTADMFVVADTDDFDPGLPLGSRLPVIRVHYQGEELTSLERFAGARGTLLFANRSIEW